MRHFDTGVLLKLYLPEPRAAEAVAFVNANPGKAPINNLHELEMRSALRQKVGRGELTQTECDALIDQVESDLTTGVHERVTVSWPDVFATAEALSAAHGVGTLCRSLDTLHVALALELGATEFCGLRPAAVTHGRSRRVGGYFLICLHENQTRMLVSRDWYHRRVDRAILARRHT